MENAIETFSLSKTFSDWWGRNKVCAVDELNLKVQPNEVFGLLGPNGSGKTTTLKLLLGLLYPTKGRAVLLGGDSTDPGISARIGFMPEESYLYRYLNARETLNFYGRLFGLPGRVCRMRIEALLDMVGLKAVANRPVGTYSKGMARRIGLAQALINDPELLILDEPTTGLDPIGTRQIKDLIGQLAKRGKTVLLCSHLLADVEDVCDRIAILYGGKIQAKGRVRELLQNTDNRQITTGPISEVAVERIKRLVQNERADCLVTSPMEKLETFFIKTVAAAQQQGRPTSGVVSDAAAPVSDFLACESVEESRSAAILDKLVSAPLSQGAQPRPVEAEASKNKPDEKLLRELTEQPKAAESRPVVKTEPVESESAEQDKIRKTVLDQLTNRPIPRNQGEKETGKSRGDSTDA